MNKIKLLISIFATVLSLLLAGCEDFFNTQPPLKYGSIINEFEFLSIGELNNPILCKKLKGKWFYVSGGIVQDISENGRVTVSCKENIASVYFNNNCEPLANIVNGMNIDFCGRMNSDGVLSSCWVCYRYICRRCFKSICSIEPLGPFFTADEEYEKMEGICQNSPNHKHFFILYINKDF